MANFRYIGIINLVVTNETRQNRQSRSICRSPSIRTSVVRVHVKECTRAGQPFSSRRIVKYIEKLVEVFAITIHNQQVTILTAAAIDVSRIAAFDPTWLSDRLGWNGIKGKTRPGLKIAAIALIPVLKFNRFQVGVCDIRPHGIRHTVNRVPACIATKIWVKSTVTTIVDEG